MMINNDDQLRGLTQKEALKAATLLTQLGLMSTKDYNLTIARIKAMGRLWGKLGRMRDEHSQHCVDRSC